MVRAVRKVPLYVVLLALVALWLLPVASSFLVSFKSSQDFVSQTWADLPTKFFFFQNLATVMKNYRRDATTKPIWWREDVCAENNVHVGIGDEVYFLSADGLLMPAKKDQPPPDLRYFKQTRK